jgi:hypothetical protein
MNCKKWFFMSLALLLAAVLIAPQLPAQTQTTGDLAGVVTDPSNAVVPNAKVVLKDTARGNLQDTKTNNEGSYRFYLLQPGHYTVTVSAGGFQSSQASVDVSLGQIMTANVQLSIGAATQTVVVTEQVPLTETENGNVSTTVGEQMVQNMPNPGNDITFTAQIAPGSVMNTGGGGLGNFSSFGTGASSNLFTINGMDDNDPFLNLNNSGATNLTLGNNEVQEVSVISNAYSGQYGGLSGAQVSYVTKSGSNDWHGKSDYYWNGRALNANDWFNNATGTPRSFVNANQWGADIGGPIIKNKVFGYFNTEGLYLVVPTSGLTNVPSSQFEAATLANIQSQFGVGSPSDLFYQQIFNLYNGAPGSSRATDSLPGGGCDNSVIAMNATQKARGSSTFFRDPAFPTGVTDPNGGTSPCALQFSSTIGNLTHDWIVAGRVDWNIGANDRMFTRIQKEHGLQASFTDPINPVFNFQSDQPEYQGQYQWTHLFSTSMVNQFIGSGQWYSAAFDNPNRAAALAAFPTNLIMANGQFALLGGEDFVIPQGRNVTQAQMSDDVSKTLGNHTIKFGLKYRRNDVTDFDLNPFSVGELVPVTLDALFQGGVDTKNPLTNFDGTPNLSELVQSFTNSKEFPVAEYNIGGYVEDDWKVKSNLMLTLALRLEHQSNPVCTTLCFASTAVQFDQLDHDPSIPYNQVIDTGRKQALPFLTTVNIEPRFGFAYSPKIFGIKNTVIRGGAGIFYDAFPANVADNFAQNSPVFNQFTVAGNNLTPGQTCGGTPCNLFNDASSSNAAFLQGFSNGETVGQIEESVPAFAPPQIAIAANRPKTPQYQKWSLDVQHTFGSNMSLDVQYVGNHGIHEFNFNAAANAFCAPNPNNPNCPDAPFTGLPTAPTDPRFGVVNTISSIGVSNYNGLATSFTKRFSSGLIQFNYTYSHALDMGSNGGVPGVAFESVNFGATNNSIVQPEDPFNPRLFNYGNADYDVTHYVSGSYVWTLPIRRALLGHGWAPAVNGWVVSGTLFARTGLPFTLVDGSASASLANSNYGPGSFVFGNQIANGPEHVNCATEFPTQPVPNENICFNTALYAPSTTGFGNVTRNQLRGPNYFNTDFTVMKTTKIPGWERGEIGIGFQFFNVLNHPNFQAPVGDLGSPQFGQIIKTVSAPTTPYGSGLGADASPRLIQLKMQFSF